MTEQPNDEHDRQDAKAAWSEAGERLSGLGSRLKKHYQQHSQTPPEQTGDDLKDAAKRLNQAVHGAFEALASASKDQSVKDDALRAGRSVGDALAGTFAGISGELSKTFGGQAKPGPAATPDPGAPDYGSPEPPASAAPVTPPVDDAAPAPVGPSMTTPESPVVPGAPVVPRSPVVPDTPAAPDSPPTASEPHTPAGSPPGVPDTEAVQPTTPDDMDPTSAI